MGAADFLMVEIVAVCSVNVAFLEVFVGWNQLRAVPASNLGNQPANVGCYDCITLVSVLIRSMISSASFTIRDTNTSTVGMS